MTEDPAAVLLVPGDTDEAIEKVWYDLQIEDAHLRSPAVQTDLLRRWTSSLGSTWIQMVRKVRHALRQHRWVVVRSQSGRASPAILAALAMTVGWLSDPYRTSWSRVLQEIPHKPEWTPDLQWHTDSTGWPKPNDVTALACMRPATSGGATDLLSLTAALKAEGLERETIAALSSASFAWPLDAALGGGYELDAIMTPHRIRFMRASLHGATDQRIRVAASRLAEAIDRVPPSISVVLGPGDTLLFDNTSCLHRRGDLVDPDRRRVLLRTKVFWRRDD